MGPILLGSLVDLFLGQHQLGGNSGGSGGGRDGGKPKNLGWEPLWGAVRARVRYDTHFPVLSLYDGESFQTLLVGTVLPTLHGPVYCKNWYL